METPEDRTIALLAVVSIHPALSNILSGSHRQSLRTVASPNFPLGLANAFSMRSSDLPSREALKWIAQVEHALETFRITKS